MDVDIYGGADPYGLPMFCRADVARWLHIPYSTVRRWAQNEPKRGVSFYRMAEYDEKRIMADSGEFVFEAEGKPVLYYPRTSQSYSVTINPLVQFGRPTATGTGINTSMLAHRVAVGETLEEVAEDYSIAVELVRAAVEFEDRAPPKSP